MPTEPYRFNQQLQESHAAADLPLWRETYEKAFPDMVAMIYHEKDGFHQRAGVDRSILLSTSKQILIDEKVRKRNKITQKVYEDIALEYVSCNRTQSPGWVCKPLLADYIAYAIAPLGKCYLLPVLQMQLAWSRHSKDWLSRFRKIESDNGSYKTLSVCVPVPVVFGSIGSCLRVEFSPIEIVED